MTSSPREASQPPTASANIRALFLTFGPNYRWFATFTAILGTFATLLSATIVNVAIPDIMGAFGMPADVAQWLSTGYLASSTVTMVLAAWAIENHGMARTFYASMIVFLIGSVLGGVATTSDLVIASRIIQGAGSGIVMPMSMLIIYQVFPLDRRGFAMGIYGVGVVLAPAIAPALGGWLIDSFSWRYVFLMAIPFVLISLPLAMLFMPEREPDARSSSFDWIGGALLTLFLTSVLMTLSDGQRQGWDSDYIAVSGFLALSSAIAFLFWEVRTGHPMIDLRLFANPAFLAAAIVTFVVGAGLYGSTYLLPLFLQTIQGLIPTDAGLLMLPAGLMMAGAFLVAGRLSDTLPPRTLIMVGLALFGISFWLFRDVDANTALVAMVWWMVLGRIGLALVFPSLNVAALRPLPESLLAQGSGILNFVRQLGGTFGVNLFTVLLARRTSLHVDSLTVTQHDGHIESLELLERIEPLLSATGAREAVSHYGGLQFLGQLIHSQGSMLGFRDTFLIVALAFFLCLIPALFLNNRSPRSP
ncbi:MAG: DHA2 family efflux MFS transporter permease subunit [Gammaproteobacteria bacterium]|nr:MAG: DHA2 family efflux MFS transporter permease subunit [Gammaproteobacteria bacterium]